MASAALTPVAGCTFASSFSNQSKSNSLLIRPNQCLSLSINRNFNLFSSKSKPSSISLIQSPPIPIVPGNRGLDLVSTRNSLAIVRSYHQQKGSGLDWPILRRWDVPWPWQTVILTSLACGIRFSPFNLLPKRRAKKGGGKKKNKRIKEMEGPKFS
ncbi:hypothetical protein Cgig2_031276 [Carnegiea gigantea]|uniref:Uncharacterized protein n=1 Tax=Carnegiea gigantea TaxID=171969 RepID=A0A9Q1KL90_9CARY|nr:hypothetical protein Cgig2_031276 [Carnegiea gigantea]